ncbi:hypothetical protein CCUS01_13730 [Colletotrichum cuscutae]|uniref:Uncharacterized protein n=1 Tax=Colletotrichum cuscutae TaxID=1209917 RepID=A0AAJ0DN06_9PEZI|nr:hypothetical protein CCUS01_13730 [Colletotrichum cuscutae]
MDKHPPAAAEASKLVNLGPRPPSWHSIANLLSSRPSYHLQSLGPPISKTEFPTGLRRLASARLPAREGESTKAPIRAPVRLSPVSIILGSLWALDSSSPRPLLVLSSSFDLSGRLAVVLTLCVQSTATHPTLFIATLYRGTATPLFPQHRPNFLLTWPLILC